MPGSLEYWDVWREIVRDFTYSIQRAEQPIFTTLAGGKDRNSPFFRGEGDDLDGFVNEHEIHRGAIVLVTVTGSGEFYVDPVRLERR